jgi:hypothetical protein
MSFGTVQAEKMTTESGYSLGAGNASSFKNRIINGGMVIDQRNDGAAVTTSGSFITDRYLAFNLTDGAFSAQRDTVAPTGFTNSLKWTTTTTDSSLGADQRCGILQIIEGFNIADLGWGTANAQSVTISFWVRSSLTGAFAVNLRNNGAARAYIASYTISSANTWEYKTVTIPGDTAGTWLTNNGVGIQLAWSLGAGSNFQTTAGSWQNGNLQGLTGQTQVIETLNATWQVTGVQLELGTVATSFDFRSYGTELALCQRYYYRIENSATETIRMTGYGGGGNTGGFVIQFPVTMRANPTGTSALGTTFTANNGAAASNISSVNSIAGSKYAVDVNVTFGTSFTSNALSYYTVGFSTATFFAASAEL